MQLSRLRYVWIAVHIFVWAAFLSILTQLVYPADRTLPGASIEGSNIGFLHEAELMAHLERAAHGATLRIETPVTSRQVSWATIGATIDRQTTVKSVLRYELWERLVPFSAIVRIVARDDYTPLIIVDQDRLGAFADKIASEDRQAAKEASVTIARGIVRVDAARVGYIFDRQAVMKQILSARFVNGQIVTLQPEIVPTVVGNRAVSAVAREADTLLDKKLILEFAGQRLIPGRDEVGQWLQIEADARGERLRLDIDNDMLRKYLEKIDDTYASPPNPVVVTLLDGREVSRTKASAGQAMNIGRAIETTRQALVGDNNNAPIAVLPVQVIEPSLEYRRTYSQTSAGLNEIIRDWEKSTYGDFGVVVRELGGGQRYAEWQPDKEFVTASTFKMFLAYAVLKEIEAGKFSSTALTDMGWTVDACMIEMIVNSTNPCAVSLQNLVGWQRVDDIVTAAGFRATKLNNQAGRVDKISTVRDESNFLQQLQSGTLLSTENTRYLLDLMKRQVWRGGIPAGVPYGTVVANKVGFYNGWIHDVGIVYGPEATYVIAIMSRGGSDPGFADLSNKVYTFFHK